MYGGGEGGRGQGEKEGEREKEKKKEGGSERKTWTWRKEAGTSRTCSSRFVFIRAFGSTVELVYEVASIGCGV